MAPNEPIVTHEPMKIVTDPSVLEKELGPGPMRFFPKGERSIQEQREALDEAEKKCCDDLKKKWQQKYPKLPFSDEMFLRFARCSPGSKKFNEKESWKVMKKFDHRFLCLSAEGLEGQLLSKVRAATHPKNTAKKEDPGVSSHLCHSFLFSDSLSPSWTHDKGGPRLLLHDASSLFSSNYLD
jgi:hypothetical protein